MKDVATGQTLSALVKNEGILRANGGRVELTAAAARHVVDSVINTSGIIEANSVGMKNGQIVLSAATADTKSGTHGWPAPPVEQRCAKVKVSGTLSARGNDNGTKGGKIVITGENIELKSATIDASGRAGGGTVMVGGDWGGGKPNRTGVNNQSAALDANAFPNATTVSVDAASTIDASARDSGNGGKVVLWANDRLTFAGTILALGGKEFGNGGFVETSGKNVADVSGTHQRGPRRHVAARSGRLSSSTPASPRRSRRRCRPAPASRSKPARPAAATATSSSIPASGSSGTHPPR